MVGILNIQLKSTICDKETNLKKVEYFIKKSLDKKLDLVVLPEYFSTGIEPEDLQAFSEDEFGGATISKIQELSKKYNTNIIAGTVIENCKGVFYNTSFAINRKGEIVDKYRKIHLYNYMGGTEGNRITSGEKYVVVDFDFGKVGMTICFDMRYPIQYKKLAQLGAKIIVQPTGWCIPSELYDNPESFEFAKSMWEAMNRTRAYDNSVYLVSSNQVGKISKDHCGIGCSMIVAPSSEIIANAKGEQCAVFADVDLDIVQYYKSVCPVVNFD
jgi:nitrilase